VQTKAFSLPKVFSCALVGALLPGLTGCEAVHRCSLTYNLWNNGEMRRFYEPAPNPRLELSYDAKQEDVLAAYDEAHETRSGIRRRAYFVNRNRLKVETGQKPHFVKPEIASGLPAVPLAVTAPASSSPGAGPQAVVSTNGQQFTLNGDFDGHTYQLPIYQDQSGMAERVLLSPLAVTGDVVMVGLVTGVVAAFLWVSSGAPRGR
jgi:hypothetical protein